IFCIPSFTLSKMLPYKLYRPPICSFIKKCGRKLAHLQRSGHWETWNGRTGPTKKGILWWLIREYDSGIHLKQGKILRLNSEDWEAGRPKTILSDIPYGILLKIFCHHHPPL